jgi:ABC-type molybdenum transport system ATPase subunit/photorepair protein PhrA
MVSVKTYHSLRYPNNSKSISWLWLTCYSKLVVVGDQSSGKSSLLEGLTGLPFPVASELCTRFATQIVFRRKPGSKETTNVSIIPAPRSSDELKEELGEFEREVTELSAGTFEQLLDEVCPSIRFDLSPC